jgi:methylmalonyl-CoA mutase, C-terminal domain
MSTDVTSRDRDAPVRVLLCKPTQDCHDRGVRYLVRKFRDAGFEVIFVNFLLAREVVAIAVDEDVTVIGVSSSSGGHLAVFEDLIAELEAVGRRDITLLAGGVIPAGDADLLRQWGVAEVFGPGTPAAAAIELVHARHTAVPVRGDP